MTVVNTKHNSAHFSRKATLNSGSIKKPSTRVIYKDTLVRIHPFIKFRG